MNPHGSVVAVVFGIAIIWAVLLDAFETVVLPRRVLRHFRLTAYFYRRTWIPWRRVASWIKNTSRQQNFLGYFGPLSLDSASRGLGGRSDFWFCPESVRDVVGTNSSAASRSRSERSFITAARRFLPLATATSCRRRGWRGPVSVI